MAVADRWSLVEYGVPKVLLGAISEQMGLSRQQVHTLLINAGERAAQTLGFSVNPVSVVGDSIRAVNMAGLLRVAPGIEIEISPKFLGLDSDNERWREDFFYLSTLSKHGRLLPSDRLQSSSGERGDLHMLVARSMVEMYWSNHRRPLRAYRLHRFNDFAFDGEIEPEDILQPNENGFTQTAMIYDRYNYHNATILAAAKYLMPNLRDPIVIRQLERMIDALSPQKIRNSRITRSSLPSRSKRWQSLFDLSVDVLNGFGITFENGKSKAPGYILDTWRVWEDLLGLGLRMGFGSNRVHTQVKSKLGTRQRIINGISQQVTSAVVKPDMTIFDSDEELSFLVDAKYKGHIENGRVRVAEADIYEALAFAKAAGCVTVVLGYPALPSSNLELGQVESFEMIEVGDTRVIGVEIESKGISSVSGLSIFSTRCTEEIENIALA